MCLLLLLSSSSLLLLLLLLIKLHVDKMKMGGRLHGRSGISNNNCGDGMRTGKELSKWAGVGMRNFNNFNEDSVQYLNYNHFKEVNFLVQ